MADEFELKDTTLPTDVEAKLLADYGDFAAVKTVAGWVAMKSATKTQYDRYYAMMHKENERAKAQEHIAHMCVVYANGVIADVSDARQGQVSTRAALAAMLEKKPGILGTVASCALEACGVDGDAETKKYGAS
jgi:hypothetical protein